MGEEAMLDSSAPPTGAGAAPEGPDMATLVAPVSEARRLFRAPEGDSDSGLAGESTAEV